MAYWKCPNKAKIIDHEERVLFREEDSDFAGAVKAFIDVPKPAHCDICDRYYTRDECTKVGT